MKFLYKRIPEFLVLFMFMSALVLWNHTVYFVIAGIVTGILILYLVIAATILPTLKKTQPKFFKGSGSFTKVQIVLCAFYLGTTWLPLLWL